MGFNKWKNVIQTEKDLKKIFPKKLGINYIYKLFGMEENIVKLEIVMERLVKYVKAVIQIKKPVKTKKA